MPGGRNRADAGEYALRVNTAAELLASGVSVAECAQLLAERFGISVRQARRYAERANASGPTAVPASTVVFTVKLPAPLVARVRELALETGTTISALVAHALREFLAAGPGKRPRR
jgi:Ribbon-helix-helix protein, copG family